MRKVIRVKFSNRIHALAVLGGDECEPRRNLHLGCSDPGCCPQHPGVIDGEPAVGIRLPEGMSGNEAHRRLVAAGIVQ